MGNRVQQQVAFCIEALKKGSLKEGDLRQIDALADDSSKRQNILYLQVRRASLTSDVIGMSLFEDSVFHDPPAEEQWPYRSVAAAMADGWRIIKFPEMALLLDEKRTYGFGWEFILEKWG